MKISQKQFGKLKTEIIKIVNDYFDNAHTRDPYDVDGAILNCRETLIQNILRVIEEQV